MSSKGGNPSGSNESGTPQTTEGFGNPPNMPYAPSAPPRPHPLPLPHPHWGTQAWWNTGRLTAPPTGWSASSLVARPQPFQLPYVNILTLNLNALQNFLKSNTQKPAELNDDVYYYNDIIKEIGIVENLKRAGRLKEAVRLNQILIKMISNRFKNYPNEYKNPAYEQYTLQIIYFLYNRIDLINQAEIAVTQGGMNLNDVLAMQSKQMKETREALNRQGGYRKKYRKGSGTRHHKGRHRPNARNTKTRKGKRRD